MQGRRRNVRWGLGEEQNNCSWDMPTIDLEDLTFIVF